VAASDERPGRRGRDWLLPALGLAWCFYFVSLGARIRAAPIDRMNREIEPMFAYLGAGLAGGAGLLALLRARAARRAGAVLIGVLCVVRILLRASTADVPVDGWDLGLLVAATLLVLAFPRQAEGERQREDPGRSRI